MAAVKLAKKTDVDARARKTDLALNAKDYAPGDGTDQTVGLQAFMDDMQADARPGYVPEGDYRFTTLTRDATLPFTLEGAGKGLTELRPLADAGAGTYALGYTGTGGENRHRIENLSLIGPGVFDLMDPDRLGTAPCQMHGLRVPQGATIRDFAVSRFNHNIRLQNDHHRLINCQSHEGYYNVYLEDQTGHGNLYVEQCDFEKCNMASLGISRMASLVWSDFQTTHFGLGPYAIYLEPGVHVPPGGLVSFQSVTFGECSFEWLGNGLIYDDDGSKTLFETLFLNSSNSFAAGPGGIPTELASKPDDYAISAYKIVDMTIDGGLMQPAAEGMVEVGSQAWNVQFKNALYPATKCRDDNKQLLKADQSFGCFVDSDGCRGRLVKLVGTAARYDLMAQGYSLEVAVLFNGSDLFRMPVGPAMQDGVAGDFIPVAVEGFHRVKTDDTITGGDYARPVTGDLRAGKVGKVRSPGDRYEPVIGALVEDSASGLVGVSWGTMTAPTSVDRSCLLTRATNFEVANPSTYTDVLWTTETVDAQGWHAANAKGVIVDQAGLYLVTVEYRWETDLTGNRAHKLKSTGGDLDFYGAPGADRFVNRSRMVRLAAGDEVWVQAWHDIAGGLDVEFEAGVSPRFQVVQVGP